MWGTRAFHFYIESMERLYGLVFAARRSDQVTPPDRALLYLASRLESPAWPLLLHQRI